MATHTRLAGMLPAPEHFTLEDFRTRKFDYRPGEGVATFGPTQVAGKSTINFALLESVTRRYPEIRPKVLVMKHTDRVVDAWTKRLGFRETPSWPAQRKLFGSKPAGHTIWPRQSLTDPEADKELRAREFRKAIIDNRLHRPSITFADELYGLIALLGLGDVLTEVVTQDAISGHGLWFASQKPSGTQGKSIPGFFLDSAQHNLFSKGGDSRNRQRIAEISIGIDPESIEYQTLRLAPFSWLYVHRSPTYWCIVDAYDRSFAVY